MISIKKWSQNCIFGSKSIFGFLEFCYNCIKIPKIDFDPKMQFRDHFLMETIGFEQHLLMTFF